MHFSHGEALAGSDSYPLREERMSGEPIRSRQDLIDAALRLLENAKCDDVAIGVRRGIIDRSVFPFDQMNVVSPFEGSARFHVHRTYEVALVPDAGNVSVCTLLSTQSAVLTAARDVFLGKEAEEQLPRDALPQLARIREALALADDGAAFDRYQRATELTGSHWYPLYVHMQHRVRTLVQVPLNDLDFFVLGKLCVHSRDIRDQATRDDPGQLRYVIPRRQQG